MLKTRLDGRTYLVTQPDHAELSGHLAAHWGNEAFTQPGHYAPVPDPERLRAAVVFAAAQHDNGWWEWEAAPELDGADGLPLGLDAGAERAGFERWRRGVRRFPEAPFASLLIAMHAHRLVALSSKSSPPEEREPAAAFLAELEADQQRLTARLRADEATASWVAPESLRPHARLISLLDALSLALCSDVIPARSGPTRGLGEDEIELPEVPRRGATDRVTLVCSPLGERRIRVRPYPFDTDPLPVRVIARVFDRPPGGSARFPTWWHAQPRTALKFRLVA